MRKTSVGSALQRDTARGKRDDEIGRAELPPSVMRRRGAADRARSPSGAPSLTHSPNERDLASLSRFCPTNRAASARPSTAA